MILSTTVSVCMQSKVINHYKNLGYTPTSFREKTTVRVADLPKGSGCRVDVLCDFCPKVFQRAFNKTTHKQLQLCKSCTFRETSTRASETPTPKLKEYRDYLRNRIGEKNPEWNPKKPEFLSYSRKVRYLSDLNYQQNINILNPFRYPRTRCGVEGGYQLDHIMSVKSAFVSGIPPEECAKLENLQMLPWQDNRAKQAS